MTQQTISVANASELNNALANATGGETILLSAGDYGKLTLRDYQFGSNVTLKSADTNALASFSEMYMKNSSMITFDSINFDYSYASGDRDYTNKFYVGNSGDITFSNSIFDGDLANGAGNGKGLLVQNSSNIDVIDTEFHTWWKAMHVSNSDDVNLIGNNIHTIRSDGVVLGGVKTALLENNYIHDFGGLAGSQDHRDMIQIQRANPEGSSDITIRNNILDMGAGDYAQGIFAGRDMANGNDPTNWHKNITVEGNVLYNAHINGIAMNMVDGLTIKENTLIAVPNGSTGSVTIPQILASGDSKNVTITQNVTPGIIGENGQADWSVQNNAIIQNKDANGAGYFGNEFITHATAQTDGYNQFQIVVGGMVDQLNAGSSFNDLPAFSYDKWVGTPTSTLPNPGSSGNTGTAGTGNGATGAPDQGTTSQTGTGSVVPDSSGSDDQADTGSVEGDDIVSSSQANDDSTEGDVTELKDPGSSEMEAELTVSESSESIDDENEEAGALSQGSDAQTSLSFDDFVLDIAGLQANEDVDLRGDAAVVDTASGPAIQFDGQYDYVRLGRLTQFEESDQIAFEVEFARDEADGSAQRLVWNHRKIGLTLTDDGLVAHVRNSDSSFYKGFKVDDLGLNDTEKHKIGVIVDQEADRLQVIVDGNVVFEETSIDFDFVGADGHEWGWNLGTAFGRPVHGEITAFAIDDDLQFIDQPVMTDELFS